MRAATFELPSGDGVVPNPDTRREGRGVGTCSPLPFFFLVSF